MSGNSHRSKFIEIAFAYWCSKEIEKRYESGCNWRRNLVFEEYLWKNSWSNYATSAYKSSVIARFLV